MPHKWFGGQEGPDDDLQRFLSDSTGKDWTTILIEMRIRALVDSEMLGTLDCLEELHLFAPELEFLFLEKVILTLPVGY